MDRTVPMSSNNLQPLKRDVQKVATLCNDVLIKTDTILNYAPSPKASEVCPLCGKLRQQLTETQHQLVSLQQRYRQMEQLLQQQPLQQQQCFEAEFRLNELENTDWQLVERTQELHRQRSSQSAELGKLRQSNTELKNQIAELKDTVDHITAQVVTYREDFETERKDRERAQGTIAELRIQLQQMKQQLQSYQSRPISSAVYQAPPSVVYQAPPSYRTTPHVPHSSQQYFNDYLPYEDIQIDGEAYQPHSSKISHQLSAELRGREAQYQSSDYQFSLKPVRATERKSLEASRQKREERFTPKPAQGMELRGRGAIYQPDTADETDSPAGCGGIIAERLCASSASPIDNYTCTDSPASKSYTRSSGKVSSSYAAPKSSDDDFFSLRLSGCEIARPSSCGEDAGDCLRCPKCNKSYNIDDHQLLLDHIEEICMQ